MAMPETLATVSTHELTTRSIDLLQLVWEAFRGQDRGRAALAERLLGDPRRPPPPPSTSEEALMASVAALLASVSTMLEEAVPFTERAMREVNSLFDKGLELLECARDALITENRVLVRHILAASAQHSQLASDYALAHQLRLAEGVCMPQASAVYLGMLEHLKGVGRHAHEIAQELALRHGPVAAAR
jgi:hypothetical protein